MAESGSKVMAIDSFVLGFFKVAFNALKHDELRGFKKGQTRSIQQ